MTIDQHMFPIVGVGASAGGVQALEGLFKNVDPEQEMAFVVVTHLSPDRESHLHSILSRHTRLKVAVAEDGMRVEPRVIYVMPPNAILTLEKRVLRLTRPQPGQRERKPIDIFFASLAKDIGERACGIVLSGGDGDGTLGVKAIKERNGLTLAQAPGSSGPQNPDMPHSAIASGVIDLAIPAEQMGQRLAHFSHSFNLLGDLVQGEDENRSAEFQKQLDEIYALLRAHTSHDFSGYKIKTFLRRLQRRMQVVQAPTIEGYIERLHQDADEIVILFRNLLINVTNFFRDADAFAMLESEVIPKLFEGRTADNTIRVWVPGCATGEEVFSIAILLREYLEKHDAVPGIQIFATDIDDAALSVARTARYPKALLDGVSRERREKFFTNDGASYVVRKEVRDLCIFSPHNVIKDPPFSRMDLVSCRNLLIYFGSRIQSRILPTFHYALKPGGYLFLGTAENISQHAELFSVVDKKHRIFQSRQLASASLPLPLEVPTVVEEPRPSGSVRAMAHTPFSLRQAIETQVMERFAPPHVVINQNGDVVYYSARTGKYLEPPQGVPNRQLLSMARCGLRLDLRNALQEARQNRQRVVKHNIALDDEDDRIQFIDLTVEPMAHRAGGEALYLVLFADVGPLVSRSDAERRATRDIDSNMADLQHELRNTRESLQATIEEYETALEELKSANEELVSVNEEGQSTNEELEASKEELQSLNEELNTINHELNDKVSELDRANSDLRNLFESTQIATVFLDRNLVIRNFTPAVSQFFKLLPSDVGRPLTDLSTHLAYDEMKSDIQAVFDSGALRERQMVRDDQGIHYLVRLIPYRDGGERIEGVVVTFIDVTALRESEEHQQVLIAELNHRVKNMLGLVTSIANQTIQRAATKEEFYETLMGRVRALTHAHEMLSRKSWLEGSLREIVATEMEPFPPEQVKYSGPQVMLPPKAAIAVSMVIHELATNANKYGALSSPDGSVEITWSHEGDHAGLRWTERDGPKIEQEAKEGFGLGLIKGEVEYSLGGTVSARFERDGLIADMVIPLAPLA